MRLSNAMAYTFLMLFNTRRIFSSSKAEALNGIQRVTSFSKANLYEPEFIGKPFDSDIEDKKCVGDFSLIAILPHLDS